MSTVDNEDGYVSVDALTSRPLPEEDFRLPDGSGKVRIRTLSRAEVLRIHKQGSKDGKMDVGAIERLTLMAGVIAPKLTESDVRAWATSDAAGGNMVAVAERIQRISGMLPGADKMHFKSDGDGSEPGV